MEITKLIGWNVRRHRVAKGLSLEDLAGLADLSPNYVGQLERGEVNAGAVALDRVGRVLNVSVSELAQPLSPGSEPPKPLKAGRKPKSK